MFVGLNCIFCIWYCSEFLGSGFPIIIQERSPDLCFASGSWWSCWGSLHTWLVASILNISCAKMGDVECKKQNEWDSYPSLPRDNALGIHLRTYFSFTHEFSQGEPHGLSQALWGKYSYPSHLSKYIEFWKGSILFFFFFYHMEG